MRMLLKTRCGCTRIIENHYKEYTSPISVWIVPLDLKYMATIQPLDYIPIEKNKNRTFRYIGYITEEDGRRTHTYEEE